MKNDLKDLIETSERLCTLLDTMCTNEKHIHDKIIIEFEKYSWQAFCMKNNLKILNEEIYGNL